MANAASKNVKPRIRKLAPWATAKSCQAANSILANASYNPMLRLGCFSRQIDQTTTRLPSRFAKSMAVMSSVGTARSNASAPDKAAKPLKTNDAVQGVTKPAVTTKS